VDSLSACFVTVFGEAVLQELESLEYGISAEWNSLAHIQLISELEARFGLRLDAAEILAMKNFAAIQAYLLAAGHLCLP